MEGIFPGFSILKMKIQRSVFPKSQDRRAPHRHALKEEHKTPKLWLLSPAGASAHQSEPTRRKAGIGERLEPTR